MRGEGGVLSKPPEKGLAGTRRWSGPSRRLSQGPRWAVRREGSSVAPTLAVLKMLCFAHRGFSSINLVCRAELARRDSTPHLAPSPETTTSPPNDVIRPIHCLTTHSTRAPSLCVLMEQAEATVRQHHDCRSDRGQSEEARPQALGRATSTTRIATPRSTRPRGGSECSRCPSVPEVLSGKASSLRSGHVLRRLVLRCVFRPQPGPLGA